MSARVIIDESPHHDGKNGMMNDQIVRQAALSLAQHKRHTVQRVNESRHQVLPTEHDGHARVPRIRRVDHLTAPIEQKQPRVRANDQEVSGDEQQQRIDVQRDALKVIRLAIAHKIRQRVRYDYDVKYVDENDPVRLAHQEQIAHSRIRILVKQIVQLADGRDIVWRLCRIFHSTRGQTHVIHKRLAADQITTVHGGGLKQTERDVAEKKLLFYFFFWFVNVECILCGSAVFGDFFSFFCSFF